MSDKEIKVIFLGESGVGKTCLIQKLISDDYKENNSTISATYYTKTIKYEGKDYKFNIWDTAGNEKFRNLTKLFLKDVQIFVLVYDTLYNQKKDIFRIAILVRLYFGTIWPQQFYYSNWK